MLYYLIVLLSTVTLPFQNLPIYSIMFILFFFTYNLGWPRGMVWGGRWEEGVRIGNKCTPLADACWCMAKPIQYCKFKIIIIIKKNKVPLTLSLSASALGSLVEFSQNFQGKKEWWFRSGPSGYPWGCRAELCCKHL